jgi:phosphatidylglycerol:prolipoprotein diacylglycerol transferase
VILHWNADPVALSLGPVDIRWYALCFLGAFLVGEWMARRRFEQIGRPDVDVFTLTALTIVGVIVGARLFHVAFYAPSYYLSHPLEILATWRGGLASHGGAIGLIVALAWGRRRYALDLPLSTIADVVALPAAIGAAAIRVANFVNSEIVGVPTRGDWGVVFERLDNVPRHPAQLYEAAAYLIIAVALGVLQRRPGFADRPGRLAGVFLLSVFGARSMLEVFKSSQATYELSAWISVGQALSLPFAALGLYLLTTRRAST